MVSDFAEQFVWMEAENAQLCKDLAAAKASFEQAESSKKLAEEAWQKNEDLEKELAKVKADLEKEVELSILGFHPDELLGKIRHHLVCGEDRLTQGKNKKAKSRTGMTRTFEPMLGCEQPRIDSGATRVEIITKQKYKKT